ncbi:MAG: hypothetical protein U1U88_000735 [Lawsonella clevelandensis]
MVGGSSGKSTMLRTVIHRIAENIPLPKRRCWWSITVASYSANACQSSGGYTCHEAGCAGLHCTADATAGIRMPAGVNDPQTLRDQ